MAINSVTGQVPGPRREPNPALRQLDRLVGT